MKFSQLSSAKHYLDQLVKTAGIMGMAGKTLAAPVTMAGKGLWNASKKTGGPFAPLLFGGSIIGGAAIAQKARSQAQNYNQGFNPYLQEALVRS